LDEEVALERPKSKIKSASETTATHPQVGYVGQDNDGNNNNDGLLMLDVEPLGDGDSKKTGTSGRLEEVVYGF